MKTDFLRRHRVAGRLLLIFAGWGTDAGFYRDALSAVPDDWDVAVAYDYTDFRLAADPTEGYDTVYLMAWSLGVAAAERCLDAAKITAAFALNGTGSPCDDRYGIPENIFRATADTLSERNLMKFRRRMTASAAEYAEVAARLPGNPDIECLRRQLYLFADSPQPAPRLPWRRAYCSREDRIFPHANQKAFWEEVCPAETISLDSAHYTDLRPLLQAVIPDTRAVGTRFHHALSSYSDHATAQRHMAVRLASMLPDTAGGDTLEIGPGSGLLTAQYAGRLRPREAWFVDLYPLPRFGIAPEERYVEADAEEWIKGTDKQFDAILSSAAIQWFSHTEAFIADAAARLKEGGILAIATFLPGNLGELDALRPAPIIYPSEEDLVRWTGRHFSDVRAVAEEIPLEFDSPREAIMHLKKTGVAGKGGGSRMRLDGLRNLPDGRTRLTFKVLYLTGTKSKG